MKWDGTAEKSVPGRLFLFQKEQKPMDPNRTSEEPIKEQALKEIEGARDLSLSSGSITSTLPKKASLAGLMSLMKGIPMSKKRPLAKR
jgi:hypothetical protein